MKLTTLCIATLAATTLFAKDPTPDENSWLKLTGGEIVKPNSMKGRIAILNAQDMMSQSDIHSAVNLLKKNIGCNITVEAVQRKEPDQAHKASGADISLLLVADETTPAMLIAPEDHWGVVNVKRLERNLKTDAAKKKFLTARYRKELIRAFCLLCGGGSSNYPGNAMNAVSIEDIDLMQELMPVDVTSRVKLYLASNGITPATVKTYRKACKEGWAPAPTNDFQRAIWDKVHQLPTKPLKIEFDPKTDTK